MVVNMLNEATNCADLAIISREGGVQEACGSLCIKQNVDGAKIKLVVPNKFATQILHYNFFSLFVITFINFIVFKFVS